MAKLPKQLYVVANSGGLGFLHAYEPGKASFEKKRITQENWAYSSGIANFSLEQVGDDWFAVGNKWAYVPPPGVGTSLVPWRELIKNPPAVWDNVPLNGFKIMKSVNRYSTSNKVWRVMDPRQLEFEITTLCLENIIMESTIKNGWVDAPCIWVSNQNLIVHGDD